MTFHYNTASNFTSTLGAEIVKKKIRQISQANVVFVKYVLLLFHSKEVAFQASEAHTKNPLPILHQ